MAAKAAMAKSAAADKDGSPDEQETKAPSATEILNSISLESIDDELVQLEQQKAELQNQIDALKQCRKVIEIRINGKPQRGASAGWTDEMRQKAAETRARKKAAKATANGAATNGSHAAGSGAFAAKVPTEELAIVEKIAMYLRRVGDAKPYSIAQNLGQSGMTSPEVLRLLRKYNDRFVIDPVDDKWGLRGT